MSSTVCFVSSRQLWPFSSNKQQREDRRALNQKLRLLCISILALLALLFCIGIVVAAVLIALLSKTTTVATTAIESTTSKDLEEVTDRFSSEIF